MGTQPSTQGDGAPLTDKLLTAIANHLNHDHGEDLLACARVTNLDWAEQARVINLDGAGITLEVSGNGNTQSLRLDFPTPANGVLAFKRTLGTIIAQNRAQLGWSDVVDDHY
jgi:hypothetical protein